MRIFRARQSYFVKTAKQRTFCNKIARALDIFQVRYVVLTRNSLSTTVTQIIFSPNQFRVKLLSKRVDFSTLCILWKSQIFTLTEKRNSWNQLFSNFFRKVTFKNFFFQKRARVNFRNFHNVLWENKKFSLTGEKFRQINYLVSSLVKAFERRVWANFRNFHPTGWKFHNSIQLSSLCHKYPVKSTFLNSKLIWWKNHVWQRYFFSTLCMHGQ